MRLFWFGLLALMFMAPANAQVDPGMLQTIKALQDGGHVVILRHGATHADQADTDPLNISNVAKQRQLNDQGRALAREIGEAMRKLKIPVGQVITSQFNRAVETGTLLGFGAVSSTADITEGGLVVSPNENNRRTALNHPALISVAAAVALTNTSITRINSR